MNTIDPEFMLSEIRFVLHQLGGWADMEISDDTMHVQVDDWKFDLKIENLDVIA